MKLERHNFDGLYRSGFRIEVMPCSHLHWLKYRSYPAEEVLGAVAEFQRIAEQITRDEPMPGAGRLRGVVMWADPLVGCFLEEGLNDATPSLSEAFGALADGVSKAIELGGAESSPGARLFAAVMKRAPGAERKAMQRAKKARCKLHKAHRERRQKK